jgi:hypothetical protein
LVKSDNYMQLYCVVFYSYYITVSVIFGHEWLRVVRECLRTRVEIRILERLLPLGLDVVGVGLEAVHSHWHLLELIAHELVYKIRIEVAHLWLMLLLLFLTVLIHHLGPSDSFFFFQFKILAPVGGFSLLVLVETLELLVHLL